MTIMRKIRLFLSTENLAESLQIKVEGSDFEYLIKVMRQKIGDKIFVFNGVDGEFEASIISIEKKFLLLEIGTKVSELIAMQNIGLAFALIKNVGIDVIAKKSVELGVKNIYPLITNNTIVDKINTERFKSNLKEACEQCERNDFPQVFKLEKLEKFLQNSDDKILLLCDESHQGKKASLLLPSISKMRKNNEEIIVLIGPEGGFSKNEFAKMREMKNVFSLSLGPRILRSDTAIAAAITLTQEFLGDW